ncbi:MAG: sigma 54-interacting transcriptional regulator [Planctomycetota bacterium]
MVQACDSLEMLLPKSGEEVLRHARSVVQFLRLLTNDAGSMRAGAVGVGLDQARAELEAHDRGRVTRALCDLLRHYLRALAGPGSFLSVGEPALAHDEAWRELDDLRGELTGLAGLPAPGETSLEVVARLLASLGELGASPSTMALWKARLARVAEGPRAAEVIVRTRLACKEEDGTPIHAEDSARCDLIACLAECLLDRGAAREAREWLAETVDASEGDARLRQLLSWSRLVLGDYASAKSAIVGLPSRTGVLPLGLAELREHKPEWLPCLAGRAPTVRAGLPEKDGARDACTAVSRVEIGASVLGVFALSPDGSTRSVHLDVAPGLRSAVEIWLEERDGACSVPGEREHELMISARAIVVHRDNERPIHGTLGAGSTLALALAPLFDAEGEVAGWLHVECEHHLLPHSDRLAALARAWGDEALLSRGTAGLGGPEAKVGASAASRGSPEDPGSMAAAEVFRELVAELAIKTAQRRWWGFVHETGQTRLVASGGDAAELSAKPEGRGRALTRAVATRGHVAFDEPDPFLALDPRAGSGTVLPLVAGGRMCGLLAVESIRRRDFGETEWTRHADTARRFGLALQIARFRGWHRVRNGFDVWFDARRGDFRDFALHLLAAARSRSPVVLCGPTGAGKSILARWVHFESRFRDGPLRSIDCGSKTTRGSFASWPDSAREGSLLLADLELLDLESQEELLRFLEDGSRGPGTEVEHTRILATTRCGLQSAVEAGAMRSDLAQRLDRLQFRVPPLLERREDIPPLVACLTGRFAEEEGLRVPSYEDEALAFLWRQPWAGNVRELESFVYKLVLLARADGALRHRPITADLVREMARRFSMPLVSRIPSRHPRPGDVIAALRVTRMAGGRTNKTRAAQYLGWDPDTLVARMKDCGIADEVRDETVWAPPQEASEEEPA